MRTVNPKTFVHEVTSEEVAPGTEVVTHTIDFSSASENPSYMSWSINWTEAADGGFTSPQFRITSHDIVDVGLTQRLLEHIVYATPWEFKVELAKLGYIDKTPLQQIEFLQSQYNQS